MNIGDRVTSRKIGNVMIGTIDMLISPEKLRQIKKMMKAVGVIIDNSDWSEYYSNWKDHPIASVRFDQAQRNISFEQYMSRMAENEQAQEVLDQLQEQGYTPQQLYEMHTTFITEKFYPIQDLEPYGG